MQRTFIAVLAEPFVIDRQVVPPRTSIGIAVYPKDANNSEALVHQADAALYEAKRVGRGVTRFATQEKLSDAKALVGRNAMREMLRNALLPPGHEPFTLVVQPIFRGQTGQLAGFEALLRWPKRPARGATRLLVLDQACALAANWPDHVTISTNLSAANFFAGDLVRDVREALERHGLAPERLKLEVTETMNSSDQNLQPVDCTPPLSVTPVIGSSPPVRGTLSL